MVRDRIRDGERIAELLASEIAGDRRRLGPLTVVDAVPDAEPADGGAFAYAVRIENHPDAEPRSGGAGRLVADVYIEPRLASVEFADADEALVRAAERTGLPVDQPGEASSGMRVRLTDGASVKRVLPVFERVLRSRDGGSNAGGGR